MKIGNKKKVAFIGLIFLILLFFLFVKKNFEQENILKINNKKIKIEIADTNEKRYKGLSGRKELCENCGMLFIFENKIKRDFVMRDMSFPLDIVWIDGKRISRIDKNLPPEEENASKLYNSQIPVNYVLEVNSGFCEKNNIKEGDLIKL